MLVLGGFIITAEYNGDCEDPAACAVISELAQIYGVSLLALGLIFGISAAIGYGNVYECRKEVCDLPGYMDPVAPSVPDNGWQSGYQILLPRITTSQSTISSNPTDEPPAPDEQSQSPEIPP